MEMRERGEIEDMSSVTIDSMQVAGRNGFGHNIEFMSQAYLRNRSSEIDIEVDDSSPSMDRALPIFLQVLHLFTL